MLSVHDVADYFLITQDRQAEGEDLITNMKLQKLCYYAQGIHLAICGEPLFEEPTLAWNHGPVVPELWRKYRNFGRDALPIPDSIQAEKYDDVTREILDDVAFTYGQFSAWALRRLTHEEPPWKETKRNEVISTKSMQDFFVTLIEEDE